MCLNCQLSKEVICHLALAQTGVEGFRLCHDKGVWSGGNTVAHHGLLIDGQWLDGQSGAHHAVRSPFSGDTIDTVALASSNDVNSAIVAAQKGARVWRNTPAHERSAVLMRAADIAASRVDAIASTISSETGKSIREARGEAGRVAEILRLSAFEGAHRYGDSLPLDANLGTGLDKVGFTIAQPVGVVAAITPFNYPALLVLHKLGPALAAGNSVILKPALAAPLTAVALGQCLLDAGLPDGVLGIVHGGGADVGAQLVADPRVNKISFTGSTKVGEQITRVAGVKKLSLELGASSPVVVTKDADIAQAAHAVSLGGYINAGQVCISVQRVIVEKDIHRDFIDALVPLVEKLSTGDPGAESTDVGTLISENEAIRVERAIAQAVADGARLVTGGGRQGAILSPAIVDVVDPTHPFSQEELFGPAISVSVAEDLDHAISLANSTPYGLGAGVFTHNQDSSIRAMRDIDAGIVHINWTPLWRADLMPYGGLKASGIGKEGIRTAVNDMSDWKTIILHHSVPNA